MQGIDAAEINNAVLVGYALSRALFEELAGPDKRRVVEKALTYLPPRPNGEFPTELVIWKRAASELRNLGGLPPAL